MRSLRRSSLIGLAAVAVALLATPARGQTLPTPLDGLWESVNTPDATSILKGARGFDERVMIADSQATREVFSQYGFLPTPSTVLSTSPIKYETVYAADRFGSLKVEGTQTSENVVSGKMTWSRVDGSVWVYNFTMTRLSTTAP